VRRAGPKVERTPAGSSCGAINLAVRKKRVRRLRAFIWQVNRALVPVLRDALTSDRGQSWMWQPSRWLQWLHSAFVRVRCRSLAGPEASANTRFRRTRANGREHPPAFAMQKVIRVPSSALKIPAKRQVLSPAKATIEPMARLRVVLLPLSTTGAQPVAPADRDDQPLSYSELSIRRDGDPSRGRIGRLQEDCVCALHGSDARLAGAKSMLIRASVQARNGARRSSAGRERLPWVS
jgi:hypothetical protein